LAMLRRRERMRTVIAVLAGFLVASGLILAGEWGYAFLTGRAIRREYYITTFPAALLALLYTGASVVLGAGVATRIQDTSETIGGFSIFQVFFGLGLVREFWSTGFSWYRIAAVLLVIPCAMLGLSLARRLGSDRVAGVA
jgi:hypothetical protein